MTHLGFLRHLSWHIFMKNDFSKKIKAMLIPLIQNLIIERAEVTIINEEPLSSRYISTKTLWRYQFCPSGTEHSYKDLKDNMKMFRVPYADSTNIAGIHLSQEDR